MMTFNHMSHVHEEVIVYEEVIVKTYAINKKNKICSRGVAIFKIT